MYSKGLVSVIVPVYNVSAYIDKCLESLLKQSYKWFEVIVVDDGSTDGSAEICNQYANVDKRIRVSHINNSGVSHARNYALSLSQGEYISFVDPDDYVSTDYLEVLVSRINDNNAGAVLCGYVECQSHKKTLIHEPIKSGLGTGKEAMYWCWRSYGYFTTLWNKLFRRIEIEHEEVMVKFDEDLKIGEDELWLVKVLPHISRVYFEPRAMYYWIQRSDSAMRKAEADGIGCGILDTMQRIVACVQADMEPQLCFAKARIYNIICDYAFRAYCDNRKEDFGVLKDSVSLYFRSWFTSDEISSMRKIKVGIIHWMIKVRIPKPVIKSVFSLKRM